MPAEEFPTRPSLNEESPHTTLPLAYTAAPIYDTNEGWLSQYSYCFDYPTVLMFFSRLAASRLPNLSDANRVYLAGGVEAVGGYLLAIDVKHEYLKNPVFRLHYGPERLVLEAVNMASGADPVQHTLDWLQTGYDWLLDQNQGHLHFPDFQYLTQPGLEPVNDAPPSWALSDAP